jgi:hypothetical protein
MAAKSDYWARRAKGELRGRSGVGQKEAMTKSIGGADTTTLSFRIDQWRHVEVAKHVRLFLDKGAASGLLFVVKRRR